MFFVSSKPFVKTANLAFSLMFMPSHIPFAIAFMFLITPQISRPITSSIIFTLNWGVANTDLTLCEFSLLFDAILDTVARFNTISDAKFGPDKAT
jgi:hypothetical protein